MVIHVLVVKYLSCVIFSFEISIILKHCPHKISSFTKLGDISIKFSGVVMKELCDTLIGGSKGVLKQSIYYFMIPLCTKSVFEMLNEILLKVFSFFFDINAKVYFILFYISGPTRTMTMLDFVSPDQMLGPTRLTAWRNYVFLFYHLIHIVSFLSPNHFFIASKQASSSY